MVILGISIILFTISAPIIALCVESARTSTIEERYERKYQEKLKRLESEFSEKEAALKKRERIVADREYELNSVPARVQYASDCLRKAEEIKRDVEQRERELEQRKQSLLRENEEIIARRVAEGIKGREKGLTADWRNLFRKARVLEETAQKMLKRAMLISEHLGVPLERILTPKEKEFVRELAKELTEDHKELIF